MDAGAVLLPGWQRGQQNPVGLCLGLGLSLGQLGRKGRCGELLMIMIHVC